MFENLKMSKKNKSKLEASKGNKDCLESKQGLTEKRGSVGRREATPLMQVRWLTEKGRMGRDLIPSGGQTPYR